MTETCQVGIGSESESESDCLVRTVEQTLRNLRFICRPERRKLGGAVGWQKLSVGQGYWEFTFRNSQE